MATQKATKRKKYHEKAARVVYHDRCVYGEPSDRFKAYKAERKAYKAERKAAAATAKERGHLEDDLARLEFVIEYLTSLEAPGRDDIVELVAFAGCVAQQVTKADDDLVVRVATAIDEAENLQKKIESNPKKRKTAL